MVVVLTVLGRYMWFCSVEVFLVIDEEEQIAAFDFKRCWRSVMAGLYIHSTLGCF